MQLLPTDTAEKIYRLLQSKLGASPDHYEREAFVYHYTIVSGAPEAHRLKCEDGVERKFHLNSNREMWVTGPDTEMVNLVLSQIHKELTSVQEFGEFTVITA